MLTGLTFPERRPWHPRFADNSGPFRKTSRPFRHRGSPDATGLTFPERRPWYPRFADDPRPFRKTSPPFRHRGSPDATGLTSPERRPWHPRCADDLGRAENVLSVPSSGKPRCYGDFVLDGCLGFFQISNYGEETATSPASPRMVSGNLLCLLDFYHGASHDRLAR